MFEISEFIASCVGVTVALVKSVEKVDLCGLELDLFDSKFDDKEELTIFDVLLSYNIKLFFGSM